MGYGVTPYPPDNQSVTKTLLISPGPPTFLVVFAYIYIFYMFLPYNSHFFLQILILLLIFYRHNTFTLG